MPYGSFFDGPPSSYYDPPSDHTEPRCSKCGEELPEREPDEDGEWHQPPCDRCERLKLEELAGAVYSIAYPRSTSKDHREQLVPHIAEWLAGDGWTPTNVALSELARLWGKENDGEIAIDRGRYLTDQGIESYCERCGRQMDPFELECPCEEEDAAREEERRSA